MALHVKFGSFVQSGASTSTQAVTGLGFVPSGVLFFLSADHLYASGSGTFGEGAHVSLGWAARHNGGVVHSLGSAFKVFDNQAADDQCYSGNDGYALMGLGSDGGFVPIRLAGYLQSLDADGFTIYWEWQFGGDYPGVTIYYLAFGGDVEAIVAESAGAGIGDATGDNTWNPTELDYAPCAVIATDAVNSLIANGFQWGVALAGQASGALTQGASSTGAANASNPSDLYHVQKFGTGVLGLDISGALAHEGTFTGLSSGAIDFNFTTAATGRSLGALILGGTGLHAQVVAITQPVSTGSHAITGLNVEPLCIVAIGAGAAASSSVVNGGWGCSVGASDGTTQGVVWSGSAHGVSPSRAACYRSSSALLVAATPAATGASSTKTAEAALTSLDTDGFTLNWTTCDGTQREFLALVIGPESVPAQSRNNLLTGENHAVDGSDNLIVGDGGEVTGDRNALFALATGSPAPVITGNRTFKVVADAVEIDAPSVQVNGAPLVAAINDLSDVAIASPADGDVLTYDSDTSTWGNAAPAGGGGTLDSLTDVAIGSPLSDGDVLTYDAGSSTWINATPTPGGGGGFVLLEQHTASSSASLDFTTFMSSTYDEYLFEIEQIVPASNAVTFQARMGTGAGPSWDSTAAYGSGGLAADSSGGSAAIHSAGASAAVSILLNNAGMSNGATEGVSGTLRLYAASGAKPHVVYSTIGFTSSGVLNFLTSGGRYNSTTALTGITFFFSAGNIASGTIRVYGIPK